MPPTTRDCRHGRLARTCEVCELEAENAALKRRVEELETARHTNQDTEPCSPDCRLCRDLKGFRPRRRRTPGTF